MSKNLERLKNDLRRLAKRCKNIKYTEGLLLAFLMTGLLTFSQMGATSPEIKEARQSIDTSISDMKKLFKEAKQENKKLLKQSNLELIQLMEQGDHVIKSPWSSWQFGMNYFYDNWQGTYKGRGDKEENRIYERGSGGLSRAVRTVDGSASKYGSSSINNLNEPISAVPIDAAVNPKDINKTALSIELPSIGAPSTPSLSVSVSDPLQIMEMSVKTPVVTVPSVNPNANPFMDYSFTRNYDNSYNASTGGSITYNNIASGSGSSNTNRSTVWSGWDTATNNFSTSFGSSNTIKTLTPSGSRPDHTIYVNHSNQYSNTGANNITGIPFDNAFVVQNMNLYLAGNMSSNPVYDTSNAEHAGVIGIHSVRNGEITNVTANLYGKANFLSIETWHAGKITLNNVDVNITNDDNTIFYIYPATYEASNGYSSGLHAYHQRGGFVGSVDANIKSNKNIVYNLLGAQGSFGINSTGTYRLEGSQNIVYSNTGYSPDFEKIASSSNPGAIQKIVGYNYTTGTLTPYINLSTPVESYGDGNILMFFANQNNNISSNSSTSGGSINVWQNGTNNHDLWNKSTLGIYQGQVGVYGIIGEKLNISSGTAQTSEGAKTGNLNNYVEKNVGILAWSGQRKDIKPAEDLGAEKSVTNNADYNNGDPIHSLWVNDVDISFGKYALNGVMFASQNGTVMDIAKSSNEYATSSANGVEKRMKTPSTTPPSQAPITDYGKLTTSTSGKVIASENDSTNEAATGTILAYSQGVFGDKMNRMSTGTSSTNEKLGGLGSEINIGTDVEMSARYHKVGTTEYYPIAYLAKDGGRITVDKTTKAHGYGSLISYAENLGSIKLTGDVTAVDNWADTTDADTKKLLYTNIGAYAKTSTGSYSSAWSNITTKDSTGTALTETIITIDGNATINGLGALAIGLNSVVELKGSNNVINSGTAGALLAQDNGKIKFYGGTITNKDNSAARGLTDNDHSNVTPFYAKNSSGANGIISFEGTTTIEMYDGILITGEAADYTAATGGTNMYQGMGNVTVNLQSDNVTIGSFKGLNNLIWDSSTDASQTFQNGLPGLSVLGGFNKNGHKYKTILTSGALNVTAPTVKLDDSTDEYNNIQMANEVVTISSGTTVSGNISSTTLKGQGLSMGSLSTATSNSTTGFVNEGTVNVTGGTATSGIAGMNVSFGTIQNGTAAGSSASVTIDNGAGLYGTNGSKLVNNGTITVSGSGVGIAGLGTGNAAQTYGTDAGASGKTVEIENHGTINVSGDKAVAIYAENNTGTAKSNVTVTNDKQITVGNEGIGIALISTAPTTVSHGTTQGGTITATASGTGSDIITGIDGKGIYAEDSDVNLTGGNYIIETKDNGIGIFASGNTNVTGTLDYNYNGNASKTGMGIVYDKNGVTNNANVNLINTTSTTGGMVGLYSTSTGGSTFTNNGNITGTSSALEFGIVSNGNHVTNTGNITLGNATAQKNANVGIYSKASNTTTNDGNIIVGNNAIGIYGYGVENNKLIQAGDNGTGIYSIGIGSLAGGTPAEDISLNSNSIITVGTNQAVGVYTAGKGQDIVANTGSKFNIGDNSFGFVNVGTGNKITSNANPVSLGNDAVYIYQNDSTGKVVNYTPVTSNGNKNYALYGNGTLENRALIDFKTGTGNVGIYSTGGTATNFDTIKVGETSTARKEYGAGMATGYFDNNPSSSTYQQISNQGTIINRGTIEVSQPNSMGMYAVGPSSTAINYGNINLTAANTTGMYLDRGAKGENWGNITSTAGLAGVKGIYLSKGSYIKNYGNITINSDDSKSADIWTDSESKANVVEKATGTNPLTGTVQTGNDASVKEVTPDGEKQVGGIKIMVPPVLSSGVSIVDVKTGIAVTPYNIDTDVALPTAVTVNVSDLLGTRIGSINIPSIFDNTNYISSSEAGTLGMYVDTSGINYTNPIKGLSNLSGLTDINLYFGTEATDYTTAKAIQIGDNILTPYNNALTSVVTAGSALNVTSASMTWMAQPVKGSTKPLETVYLVKIPYQAFAAAGDSDTYNFLAGLEQRYGTEGLGSREHEIFKKLNSLGNGEGHILAQAIDEMKGHQYANIQQRIYGTGRMIDKEISHLTDDWRNTTRQSNKIKAFGMRDEYSTDTAGIIDYKSDAYGFVYVHEDEALKLGNSTGWYVGAAHNRIDFDDIGKSKENMTMLKAGLFKSTAFDHNGSLQWTIAGDIFGGINNIERRFWIVDEVFHAESDYYSYGASVKNELGYSIRTSERTSIRPYASLDIEYGRFSDIKEEKGEMRLEVKGNDYISVKPEVGVEFKYRQPIAVKTNLSIGVSAAYGNELGKLNKVNQARVGYTTADWYNLRNEKEDRKGSAKFDLNIGLDNTRFGVTLNAGYDTKGENIRGGIGFRAIY